MKCRVAYDAAYKPSNLRAGLRNLLPVKNMIGVTEMLRVNNISAVFPVVSVRYWIGFAVSASFNQSEISKKNGTEHKMCTAGLKNLFKRVFSGPFLHKENLPPLHIR